MRRPPTCETRYQALRDSFVAHIDRYDEHDPGDNERIKDCLRAHVKAIDGMGTETDGGALTEALRGLFEELNRVDVSGPVQALVFSFNPDHGQFFLGAYGPVPTSVLRDPGEEFAHDSQVASKVAVDRLGPVTYESYEEQLYESFDVEREFDLSDEQDTIRPLRLLRAYMHIKSAFLEVFEPRLVPGLELVEPCLVYAQEANGGEGDLIAVVEESRR